MKFNLEEAIKEHTNEEGVIDWEKAMELVDTKYVNPIVAKNKPDKDKIISDSKEEWIKSLGFEGIADESQLKAYVKQSSDEYKEKYVTLEAKHKEIVLANEKLQADYETSNTKLTSYERQQLLTKDNFNGDAEYALYKINQSISDDKDFETAYNEYKESNPTLFAKNQIPPTSGRRIIPNEPNQKAGWEELLEEKHPNLKL